MTLPYDEIHVEDLEVSPTTACSPRRTAWGRSSSSPWSVCGHPPAGRRTAWSSPSTMGVSAFLTDYMHQNTFQLIETAAEHMAEEVLLHYPW